MPLFVRMSTPPEPPTLPGPDDEQRWITLNRQAVAGAFVSGLAHELNNPLQVMTGTVELLLARQDLPADVVTRLERIAQQVNRASATLIDVVGFIRERPAAPTRVDLCTVVERVLGLRRYPLTRAMITVVTDLPPAGRAIVVGKAPELAQAVLNLIMNAEAALAPPSLPLAAPVGKPAELRVSIELAPGAVRVRLADNGFGVSPDVSPRLFEPFVSSRSVDVAAGIGLTAASALVARNGGRLFHEPTPAGASFVIELPAAGSG